MSTATERKHLVSAYALAAEMLEMAKTSADDANAALAELEAAQAAEIAEMEEEDFVSFLLRETTEQEAWIRAVAVSAGEALKTAEARFEAAEKALEARDKAARERRWSGLVKSGGADAWRYNTRRGDSALGAL